MKKVKKRNYREVIKILTLKIINNKRINLKISF